MREEEEEEEAEEEEGGGSVLRVVMEGEVLPGEWNEGEGAASEGGDILRRADGNGGTHRAFFHDRSFKALGKKGDGGVGVWG